MTDKIPVRGVFSGTTATGLAEFQTGEKIAVTFGGTGATSHTANALLLGDGTSAIQSSTITLDGTTFATSDSTTITIAEGLVVTGDLTVQGTTTSIDSSSINVTDRFVFEGSSADANETTLIVENPDADRTVTIPNATGTLVLKDTTDTLTNKTISGSSNTLSDIPNSAITNSSISINSTVVSLGGSITIPTADSGYISFGDESSNNYDAFLFKGFSFLGGEGIDTTISGPTLTIAGEDATASNKGIASFSSDDFAVSSGAVTVKASGITNTQLAGSIANAKLANSSITINGSGVSLGGSVSIDTSFTLAADSGSNDSFSTGNTLTFSGGEGIDTTVSNDEITIAGEDASTSNKGVASFSSDNFSVSSGAVTIKDGGVANAELAGSIANSKLSNSSITIGDESSNTFDINLGDELSVVGGEGVDTTITGNLLTIAGEDATTSNKGIASFASADFAVSSGAVTVKASGITNAQLAGSIANDKLAGSIANAKLANSTITVAGDSGSTAIDLGDTLTVSGTANEIATSQSGDTLTISLPDDVTIGNDLTITGDLTVQGDTTTVSTTNTVAKDQLFELGNGRTGSATGDAGIVIERGNDANLFIGYDESADKFTVGTGTFTGASTGNLSITKGEIVADIDGNNSTLTNIPNSAITNSFITVGDESSNEFDVQLGTSLSIVGGEGVDTTISGNLMTIAGEDATASNKGIASFSSDDFSVSSGAVTVKSSGITNAQLAGSIANDKLAGSIANDKLANSAVTINGSAVSLGGSVTITGSEISTAGDIFSNYNTISSNADITTASTKNAFLFGEINISSNAVLDVGGNGTLEIV
tara:strand:- start:36 stop:2513 length:2478 start_codon:yes stop_codon:yes gene_type:complete